MQALAGGTCAGVGYVFGIKTAVAACHGFPEKAEAFPNISGSVKESFQTAVSGIAISETPAEVPQIIFKKSTVNAMLSKLSEVPFHHKIVRARAQKAEHPFRRFEDQISPSPGNCRGEEGGDLPVGSAFIPVGKLNRILRDKFRYVDLQIETIQFLLKSSNSWEPPG